MSKILTYNNRPLDTGHYNFIRYGYDDEWVPVTWANNKIPLYGKNVWKGKDDTTDEPVYYYNNGSPSYVLASENTWVDKRWAGDLSFFNGSWVWQGTDGVIYCSNGSDEQYKLERNGSIYIWSKKRWENSSGQEIFFIRSVIWNDGVKDYFGNWYYRYDWITWYSKRWTGGPSPFYGGSIWKDNSGNIYYSNQLNQYTVNTSTSTFTAKTWDGFTPVYGKYVWHDLNGRIFYSDGSLQYELEQSTYTWIPKTWPGLNSFDGENIWNDGTNIYYSNGDAQFRLITVE